jgi:hypothetical protein
LLDLLIGIHVGDQVAAKEQQRPIAHVGVCVEAVRDQNGGRAQFAKPLDPLLSSIGELHVAHRNHLVEEQNLGLDGGRD